MDQSGKSSASTPRRGQPPISGRPTPEPSSQPAHDPLEPTIPPASSTSSGAGGSSPRPTGPARTGAAPVVPPAQDGEPGIVGPSQRIPPSLDRDGMPLPRRVTERDTGATTVSPAAYAPSRYDTPSHGSRRASPPGRFPGGGGCLLRMAILGVFAAALLVILAASFAVVEYARLAASLPAVDDLQSHAAQFETTRILDRDGNLLYEILDPQAGRRTYVPLSQISPLLVAATLATEDSQFYSHPGFDPAAITRAIWQNLQGGETVSGASTITQQLARNLLLTAEERTQRTALRKIREILLAAEINRRYSKDDILELYLNQNYYGNFAYGIEAAAETYFDTTAGALSLSQASFLAGLVQAPSIYDIYTNRPATLERQRQVLTLMVLTSDAKGCIDVSNAPEPLCITPEEAGAAAAELENLEFRTADVQMRFPHWVNYVRSELERLYDPQTIYRSGFTVYTTLDPDLQQVAEDLVRQQVDSLADRHVTDGALVAIQPGTGEILAMVGSADYNNEAIAGQINMSISPRQPGSSIKPLTYTAAFEKGWTPATLIWDVPSEFPPSGNPDDPRAPYEPVNYDEKFHGPVVVRTALANSYNVPAVKTLQFVGIYDDPSTPEEEGLVAFAKRLGITTLTRDDYGLSLTLGGGDVSLLELANAYAVFANGGKFIPTVAITRIDDHLGNTTYEYQQPDIKQVVSGEHAYLITSILSDNAARQPGFGLDSPLNLPFPAAAKTGTTNDYRDNWTLGFTPDLVAGVWVGNADYTPMEHTSGLTGAAPIWNAFMQAAVPALTGGQVSEFNQPETIVQKVVCSISGAEPSEWCPKDRVEIFAPDQLPLPAEEDLWQEVWVDSFSLQLASSECSDYARKKVGLDVTDTFAREWITDSDEGKKWADDAGFDDDVFFIPTKTCSNDSPRPILAITAPDEGNTITESVYEVVGKAGATGDFENWSLDYGIGNNPRKWISITRSNQQEKASTVLAGWEVRDIPNGPITLRLTVRSKRGGSAEVRVHVTTNVPTPTPEPTGTPTDTPEPTSTATPTPTDTPEPTSTATPTDTPGP
jgi:penicillin-binding protein 1C